MSLQKKLSSLRLLKDVLPKTDYVRLGEALEAVHDVASTLESEAKTGLEIALKVKTERDRNLVKEIRKEKLITPKRSEEKWILLSTVKKALLVSPTTPPSTDSWIRHVCYECRYLPRTDGNLNCIKHNETRCPDDPACKDLIERKKEKEGSK